MEIKSAVAVADWIAGGGLAGVLPASIRVDITRAALGGHSRGGKVAFALAVAGNAKLRFSALIGVDPVDGLDVGRQTTPAVLTHVPGSLDLKMAALVIGAGLGGERRSPLFPPCSPEGLGHRNFFRECGGGAPAWHAVARDYGHTDMLDDETKGVRGMLTYCVCKSGGSRKPMRDFVGGMAVAFLKAYLEGDAGKLLDVRRHPESAPVVLSTLEFRE